MRNEELEGMIQAMQDLERTWNSKFNYPWTFFNDVSFTAEFKEKTQAQTKAKCYYGKLLRPIKMTSRTYILRIDTERTLGGPVMDKYGPVPRICQDTQRG